MQRGGKGIKKYSGLQKSVLCLYRQVLRVVFTKRGVMDNVNYRRLYDKVQGEFRMGAGLNKTEIDKIERRLIEGKKKKDFLEMKSITSFSTFS